MTTTLDQQVVATTKRFVALYGSQPQWIVAAPGRVNLIGEHIDYNDGFVLPMAIDRYTVIAAGPTTSEHAVFVSNLVEGDVAISLITPERHNVRGHWSNYLSGVIAGCLRREMRPGGFCAVIGSDVPLGSGLSSSAALEVAIATLIEAMTGTILNATTKALLCQEAENDFAGVPCGIMDQFASTLCQADHLILLDCRSQQVELIPMTDPSVTVLIINSNVKHELSDGEYSKRRDQCNSAALMLGLTSLRDATLQDLVANREKLTDIEYRRARHAVTEIGRTGAAAEALKHREWPEVGELMFESHRSLRDDFNVSCCELDLLVELAQDIGRAGGVYGSRMTGGGFGGCTVSLVETSSLHQVTGKVVDAYRAATGIKPTAITSRPSRGAHLVQKHVDPECKSGDHSH